MTKKRIFPKTSPQTYSELLSEQEIEETLKKHPLLTRFWQKISPQLLFRHQATEEDPIYEIQLVWDLGEKTETYGWIWADALEGTILKIIPD